MRQTPLGKPRRFSPSRHVLPRQAPRLALRGQRRAAVQSRTRWRSADCVGDVVRDLPAIATPSATRLVARLHRAAAFAPRASALAMPRRGSTRTGVGRIVISRIAVPPSLSALGRPKWPRIPARRATRGCSHLARGPRCWVACGRSPWGTFGGLSSAALTQTVHNRLERTAPLRYKSTTCGRLENYEPRGRGFNSCQPHQLIERGLYPSKDAGLFCWNPVRPMPYR